MASPAAFPIERVKQLKAFTAKALRNNLIGTYLDNAGITPGPTEAAAIALLCALDIALDTLIEENS